MSVVDYSIWKCHMVFSTIEILFWLLGDYPLFSAVPKRILAPSAAPRAACAAACDCTSLFYLSTKTVVYIIS